VESYYYKRRSSQFRAKQKLLNFPSAYIEDLSQFGIQSHSLILGQQLLSALSDLFQPSRYLRSESQRPTSRTTGQSSFSYTSYFTI